MARKRMGNPRTGGGFGGRPVTTARPNGKRRLPLITRGGRLAGPSLAGMGVMGTKSGKPGKLTMGIAKQGAGRRLKRPTRRGAR